MPSRRAINVFVSSTSEDLRDYRAVARNVILDMKWVPQMMEHFGASQQPTLNAVAEALDECQVMLLIVAFRRGWVPQQEQGGNGIDSITSLELQLARAKHVAVLPILASEESWPGKLWEDDQPAREWVRHFREGLGQPAIFFDYESPVGPEAQRLPAFRARIRAALVEQKEKLQTTDATAVGGLDYFSSARDGLVDGSSIPFVGQGIFGAGALGVEALLSRLAGPESAVERNLASAAEYQERYRGSRKKFLRFLEGVIEDGQRTAPVPMVLDLLADVRAPTLIVSATLDLVLEERLRTAGKRCLIATHIIRSYEGAEDGKILVLRGDQTEVCLADRMDVTDVDYLIYKPLGSPLLHRCVDPEKEIDTVVITESDYLTFLGRLQNQHTRIPTSFTRPLQRRPLLFLGYPMDVWQCRLLVQVFETIGIGAKHESFVAVRQPASSMEELIWKRLGADLIQLDPNDFAQRVASEREADQGAKS